MLEPRQLSLVLTLLHDHSLRSLEEQLRHARRQAFEAGLEFDAIELELQELRDEMQRRAEVANDGR